MKQFLIILILLLVSLSINAQQSNPEPITKLAFKLNKNLYLSGLSGFGENSYIVSAGIQAAKLLEVTCHGKNVVNFNVDFAGIQVRKQYDSDNIRPGGYLSGSLVKNIFSIDGFVFSAANRTIIDYGKNQFTSDAFVGDDAMHLEISNLAGISVNKNLFKKQKTKIILISGLNISNVEQPRIGYIATIMRKLPGRFLAFAKDDNATTMVHKLTVGVMYIFY